MSEQGPIYGVELIDSLPLGDTGIKQALPSRDDLTRVREFSERTVAGYEVLLKHYRELSVQRDAARRWLRGDLADTEIGDPAGPTFCAYCGEMLCDRQHGIEHCQKCDSNPLVKALRTIATSEIPTSDIGTDQESVAYRGFSEELQRIAREAIGMEES